MIAKLSNPPPSAAGFELPLSLPPLPGGAPLPWLPGGNSLITQSSRFTPDFQSWLKDHGYGNFDFAKNPNRLAAFGGRASAGEPLTHEPVIFIHGNTDTAASLDAQVAQYKAKGYKDNELYVMSWGDGKIPNFGNNYHSKHFVQEVRNFIKAVHEYTGSSKVDVVAHSMGVTLARKAIKGGHATDSKDGGDYDLGEPLTPFVDTFVGISGANRGLDNCAMSPLATCSTEDGFSTDSKYLRELNADPMREGDHVYSIFSLSDSILGRGAHGARITGPIAGEDGEEVLQRQSHFQARDQTVDEQLDMIQNHHAPASGGFQNPWDPFSLYTPEEVEEAKHEFPGMIEPEIEE